MQGGEHSVVVEMRRNKNVRVEVLPDCYVSSWKVCVMCSEAFFKHRTVTWSSTPYVARLDGRLKMCVFQSSIIEETHAHDSADFLHNGVMTPLDHRSFSVCFFSSFRMNSLRNIIAYRYSHTTTHVHTHACTRTRERTKGASF